MRYILNILEILVVVMLTSCDMSVSPFENALNATIIPVGGSYPNIHYSIYPKCDSFKTSWTLIHHNTEYNFNSSYKIGTMTSGLYLHNVYEKSDTGNVVVKPKFDISIPWYSKEFYPFFGEKSFQLDANNTPGFSKVYDIKYGGGAQSTISKIDSVEHVDKNGQKSIRITNREVKVHLIMTDHTQKDTIIIDGKFFFTSNPNY